VRQLVSLHYAAVPAQPWAALEKLWLPRLPAAKSASVARLRNAADRNATLLGIALLARALRALDRDLDAGALEFPRAGKPRLPGGPDFSVSHSGGLVACALATAGRIGLDLEPVAAVRASTVARVMSAQERARMARGELAATDAWVMKEAVVKAAGRGIGALGAVALGGGRARLEQDEFWLRRVERVRSHAIWVARDRPWTRLAVREVAAAEFAPLPAAR
jgi:4'-phosphopantetheinyl transferase